MLLRAGKRKLPDPVAEAPWRPPERGRVAQRTAVENACMHEVVAIHPAGEAGLSKSSQAHLIDRTPDWGRHGAGEAPKGSKLLEDDLDECGTQGRQYPSHNQRANTFSPLGSNLSQPRGKCWLPWGGGGVETESGSAA